MLIDLERLRLLPELLSAGAAVLREHPDCFCYDQDILNVVFADSYRPLPVCYDAFVVAERRKGYPLREYLYHYAGQALDFFLPSDPFNRLFLHYYLRSPWWDEAAFEGLFGGVAQAYESWRAHSREVFQAAGGRRWVIVGEEARREECLRFLAPTGQERFQAVMDDAGQLFVSRLMETVRKERGAFLLFCLPEAAYEALHPYLEKEGLAEHRDFIDGRQFLPTDKGGWQLSGSAFFAGL